MEELIKPAIDLSTVQWRTMGTGDLNRVIHQVLGWTHQDDLYVYKHIPAHIPDDKAYDWWCKEVNAGRDIPDNQHCAWSYTWKVGDAFTLPGLADDWGMEINHGLSPEPNMRSVNVAIGERYFGTAQYEIRTDWAAPYYRNEALAFAICRAWMDWQANR